MSSRVVDRAVDWCLAESRRFAYLGARYGPKWWLRYSPSTIGAVAFLIAGKQRRVMRRRLEWVLGRPVGWVETLPSFVNFAHCLAESLGAEGHPAEVEFRGLSNLREIVARGRGAILMTAHVGAWELSASRWPSDLGADIVLVMEAEPNSRARSVHERLRDRLGVRFVYTDRNPLVGLVLQEELRRGSVLAFQLDRDAQSSRSLETRLFGRRFLVPEGPFRLARMTGAPLLPTFACRTSFLRHRVEIRQVIPVARRATGPEIAASAQAVVRAFEDFVAEVPSQWFDFAGTSDGSHAKSSLSIG